ncbi:MAG: type II secretion system F family protein [Ignavibacteriales bacterium]
MVIANEDNILGLNINGHDVTNQDIIVVYEPDSSVISYQYNIYKDNNLLKENIVDSNTKSTIVLDETGVYHIEIITNDVYNSSNTYMTNTYNIDKNPPVINIDTNLIEMDLGSDIDLYEHVTATDNFDGNLTNFVTTNYSELDFNEVGVKKLIYTVGDEAGNITTKSININVVDNYSSTLMYLQISVAVILLIITFFVFRFRKSVKLEKRISAFSINTEKDDIWLSLDSFSNYYHRMIKGLSICFKKSTLLTKYSYKYKKYISLSDNNKNAMDFVSNKIFISFIFLIMAIFAKTIQFQLLHSYEIVVPLLVGFFLPDIYYIVKYRLYRNKIENDMLQAIVVMNNAFKSGRSIIQAIELVSKELEGAIAEEFKKMYLELSLGLEIDVVFSRFSERIKLEEVTYLTASLSILNKTGGNIISVFSSIEKSLFNKKRLKLELESLTGSSRMIVYVLFLVPILFVVFVSIINPGYFAPFLNSTEGLILLGIMILYYIVYVIFVRKIMKVRM